VKIPETLDKITKIIGQNAARSDIGLRVTKNLADIERRLQSIVAELVNLEDYIKFTTTENAEKPKLSAKQLAALPVDDLIERSALIGALYRSGVSIHRHTVFGAVEAEIAATIAKDYSDFSAILRSYRQAYKNTKTNVLTMSFSGGASIYNFINLLKHHKVITVKKILLKKDDHWVPHKFEYLKNATAKQSLRVMFKIDNPGLSAFFCGDWMTAFTAQIVEDHLDRNRIPHETFAKVSYQAPVDVISTRSDFDVISKFEEKVLCFECKSGVIHDADIGDIAEKSGDIKKVLTQFLSEELTFEFFLIFDSELNDKEKIVQRFSTLGIMALEIREVRKMIFDTHAVPKPSKEPVLVLV